MYIHIMVTNTPNAPHHSAFFGAFHLTPDSINPKSDIKLKAATHKMNAVIPIPIGPEVCRYGTSNGVNQEKSHEITYISIIDATRLPITLLNVGVALITLDE